MLMTTQVPEHADPVTHACTLHEAAMACYTAGKHRQAVSLWRRAVRGLERAIGPQHPDVAVVLHNLAALQQACGRLAEAEQSYQWALTLKKQLFGRKHLDVALTAHNLAMLYSAQGRYAEAVPLLRRARHIFATTLAPQHRHVVTCRENYAAVRREVRAARAVPPCLSGLGT
jgi:tetratricopeptide (TPR) repeat protein